MFSLPRLPRLLVLGHELFDRAKKTGNGDDATPEFGTAVGCHLAQFYVGGFPFRRNWTKPKVSCLIFEQSTPCEPLPNVSVLHKCGSHLRLMDVAHDPGGGGRSPETGLGF